MMRVGRLVALLCLVGITVGVGGCGVRGSLEQPPDALQPTAQAESGQGKAEGDAPRPHKGFILDGLVR